MIVLLAAVQAMSSINAAVLTQYHSRLASEAAESGAAMAQSCLRTNENNITWTNAKPLRPNTDCNGDNVSGAAQYVMNSDGLRSTFTVGIGATPETEDTIVSDGMLQQIRTTTGAVWRTTTQTIRGEKPGDPVVSTNVAIGQNSRCAIMAEHTRCSGGNEAGQMGNGRIEPTHEATYLQPEAVMRQSGVLLGKSDKFVVAGLGAACTVTTDNSIVCWGRTGYGSLGFPQGTGMQPVPTLVTKPSGMTGEITGMAMGYWATCAIAGGDLWCTGRNDHGQLGTGNYTNSSSYVRVPNIGTHVGAPVTDIASHTYAASFCAVADGEVYCWGQNTYGQLGDNSTTTRTLPTLVAQQAGGLAGKSVKKVVHVRAIRTYDGAISSPDGENNGCTPANRDCYVQSHSCALTTDGEVYCWGANRYGQMGQGSWTTTNQLVPIKVNGALSGKTVKDIASSYRNPCALTTEPDTGDRLYCWGGNTHHGTGGWGNTASCNNSAPNNTYCSPTPVVMQTPGLKDKRIDAVFGSVNNMCALAEGVSYCVGANNVGQIGDGTTIARMVPTEAKLFRESRSIIIY